MIFTFFTLLTVGLLVDACSHPTVRPTNKVSVDEAHKMNE